MRGSVQARGRVDEDGRGEWFRGGSGHGGEHDHGDIVLTIGRRVTVMGLGGSGRRGGGLEGGTEGGRMPSGRCYLLVGRAREMGGRIGRRGGGGPITKRALEWVHQRKGEETYTMVGRVGLESFSSAILRAD